MGGKPAGPKDLPIEPFSKTLDMHFVLFFIDQSPPWAIYFGNKKGSIFGLSISHGLHKENNLR